MKIFNANGYFVSNLAKWNKLSNRRVMPWKNEKNPYKIWLSEIILQQTRVAQGMDFYNRFVSAFPTIHELANASETEVFKLWEGLGYYNRCKNLISTANFVSKDLKGIFPDEYDQILKLKGIGPYTAAAISSFAFNQPFAVLDGNVFRVLARFFGIDVPIDSKRGKDIFIALANELLDKNKPGVYNQALMDFGAVICKPQVPLCSVCPLNKHCIAFSKKIVLHLPVKEKSLVKKIRWFYYFVIENNGNFYIRKRVSKDIWENLYEFILIESKEALALDHIHSLEEVKRVVGKSKFQVLHISQSYKQILTHQTIYGQFIRIKVDHLSQLENYITATKKDLVRLPFPKLITNYLSDKNVSLNLF